MICPLGLPFFGLTPSDRISTFRQIHEIVFHGGGGYDWETVYNMPIWLRNFTFRLLKDFLEKKEDDLPPPTTPTVIQRPDFRTNYTAKASTK